MEWLYLPLLLLLLLRLSQVPLTVHAATGCYNPDGTDRNDQFSWAVYTPCPGRPGGSGGHHMCCRRNSSQPDTCQSNGLCYNADSTELWRESCTDQTWKDPGCLQLCNEDRIGYDGVAMNTHDIRITRCPNGSFCCGLDTWNTCCQSHQGFFIGEDGQVSPDTTGNATTTTAPAAAQDATTTSSPLASNHNNNNPSNPSKTPTATIAGVAVGSGIGAALLFGLLTFFFLRMRKQNQHQHQHNSHGHGHGGHGRWTKGPHAVNEFPDSEIYMQPSHHTPHTPTCTHEVWTQEGTRELDGRQDPVMLGNHPGTPRVQQPHLSY